MAKTTRQRIQYGGSLQSPSSESSSFPWHKFFKRHSIGHEDRSEAACAQHRSSLQRTMSERDSSMPRNKSRTSAVERDEGRNGGSSVTAQSQASKQNLDISLLPTRLRPHGESIQKFVQLLSDVSPALSEVLKVCSKHRDEVESMDGVLKQNETLRAENEDQMTKIKALNVSLGMAHRSNDGERRDFEDAKEKVEEEKEHLAQLHKEVEQRAAEQMEKQKLKLATKKAQLAQEYEERGAKLKKDLLEEKSLLEKETNDKMRAAAQEHEKQRKKLDMDRTKAETQAMSLQQELKDLQEEKRGLNQEIREAKMLKEHLDSKNKQLEDQVSGFRSQGRPSTDYTAKFKVIERNIQVLAAEYLRNFRSVSPKRVEEIHQQMSDKDILFRAVPLFETDHSSPLHRVHIQRVVALNVVQTIWKPFSCDRLVDRPDLSNFLLDTQRCIAAETHKGSPQDVFWTTRTCRALQSLRSFEDAGRSATAAALPAKATSSARVEKAYTSIESVIQPLIEEAKLKDFQQHLIKILQDCVDIWDQAMADEKWFEAQSSLSSELYDNCRSKEFDPLLGRGKDGKRADGEADEMTKNGSALASAPCSPGELLTLFPLIRIRHPNYDGHGFAARKLPGSFPEDGSSSEQAQMARDARRVEVLHSGCALATTSELVLMGKKEVDEQAALLEQAINEVREQLKNDRHKRRSSMASAITLVAPIEEIA